MLAPQEWEKENARLARTLHAIHTRLAEVEAIAKRHKERVVTARKTMWEELPHTVESLDEAILIIQQQKYVSEYERDYLIYRRLIPILERMASSPYFGRIDFCENGAARAQQIYIGISSLVEPQTGEHLVYDWRAPIASMFYDYQPGPGSYETGSMVIEGEILLKRQYKISKGKLLYVFDTELTIDDELLQEILSQSADQRMRTIVQSIQREQNRAIRDEGHPLLVVQGPAGSGKTSIALHRVAYLLYRHRKTLKAKDIVVISPNEVFNDYISSVLPDLGEENMQQTTFADLVRRHLLGETLDEAGGTDARSSHIAPAGPGSGNVPVGDLQDEPDGALIARHETTPHRARPLSVEESGAHLEYLFARRGTPGYDQRVREIAYKGSPAFLAAVRRYVDKLLQGEGIDFGDIEFQGKLVISRDELKKLVTETYSYLPFSKRLEKAGRRVLYLLEPAREERLRAVKARLERDPNHNDLNAREIASLARTLVDEEFRPVEQAISRFTSIDVLDHYANLFRDPHRLLDAAQSAVAHHASGGQDRDRVAGADGGQPGGLPSAEELAAIGAATLERLGERRIAYEDIAPLLYLKAALGEIQGDRRIRHVVIDEAQDYSLFHFEVFRKLYPAATFTVLGDPAQSIHPYLGTAELASVESAIAPGKAKVIQLTISYRSTQEIVALARAIDRAPVEARAIERSGPRPLIVRVDAPERLADAALRQLQSFHAGGVQRVAIICKTAAESEQAFAALRKNVPVHLVTAADDALPPGDLVIPAYLAKGLEFDGVLIYNAGAAAYGDASERKLFYTACTRALHRLGLLYAGELTPFLQGAVPALADHVDYGELR